MYNTLGIILIARMHVCGGVFSANTQLTCGVRQMSEGLMMLHGYCYTRVVLLLHAQLTVMRYLLCTRVSIATEYPAELYVQLSK